MALALTLTIDPGVALAHPISRGGSKSHSALRATNGAGTGSALVAKSATPRVAVPTPVVPRVAVPTPVVPQVAVPTPVAAQVAVSPPVQQALVVLKGGSGTGRVTSVGTKGIDCGQTCSHVFNNGTQVMLSATPGAGSSFTGFSGAGCSGTGPCTVTVGANAMVTATFTAASEETGELPLTVMKDGTGTGTVTSSIPGIDCGPTCSSVFNDHRQITLTATPDSGSSFAGFSGGGCSGTGPCTVDDAATVTATFTAANEEAGELPLTVSKDGTGTGTVTSSIPGIDCGQTCSFAFNDEAQVTLTATPDAGSSFAGFSGGGCSGTTTCTVDDGVTVTATFTAVTQEAGELPFTGYDTTGAILLGLVLIGFGLGGRVLVRHAL